MGKFIPSNQTRGARLVATVPVTQDNQQINIDLPRGPHIETAWIRIAGTIAVGTLFAGGVRSLAPYYILRRCDWVMNSNVTLDSISGPQLAQLLVTRRNTPPATNPLAAVGATSFAATFPLDRCLMDMMRPKDSMLKTDVGISNSQLRIQLGALADMYGNGAGAATYTSVTLSVWVNDYQESRDKAGNTPAPIWYVKRNGFSQQFAAAGNGQQFKLNTGNRLRIFSFRVLDGTTFEPNAALFSRLRIQRAGDTRFDLTANELAAMNQATFGFTLPAGQFLWDFANTGQLGVRYSEFWPIPSSADTYALFDLSGAARIEVATIEGVDLQPKAAAGT